MRQIENFLKVGAVALAAILAAAPASATVITATQTQSLSTTTTNWNAGNTPGATFTFAKFDSALGSLIAVHYSIASSVTGTAKAESLDASPTSISLTLAATVSLLRPGGASLAIVIPTIVSNFSASAFDGSIDFGGTSGTTLTPSSSQASQVGSTSTAPDLALFSGPGGAPGTILLTASATGASTGSGAGNLLTQFQTSADAIATLYYEYDLPPEITVPEPASLALLGVSMTAIGVLRRRRAA